MFQADASDFLRLSRAIAKLPHEIRAKAANRALRRIEAMAKTRVARRSAERIKAPVGKVKQRIGSGRLSADALEFKVRSEWLRLIDLGARQTAQGVTVRGRGSYRSAFIASMRSRGVFMREGKARGPVNELFGPNPANDMNNHPDVFAAVLEDLIASHLLPRVLHEIEYLLPSR
ncbi:MAG TPA: hypothetical protein VGV39_00225 [Mesorhizobium sp.]|jgi:hypothetical protein|uniref:hypothetical protein n=1 Tax=Mesorhizobium sp. TaxID=1871066 RepID=UPI002DDD3361|nr:hypothetical protein [Mesorhizobium sp.]HEV2501466.1 hypothetical protein [Mesorhizobium sp.]